MLKDVPAARGNVENLPGVRLNMQAQGGAAGGNCSERQVSSLGFGDMRGGSVSECKFGNFTFSTSRPSSPLAPSWHSGVPSPFGSNDGPPPGSGGFAPRPSNGFW